MELIKTPATERVNPTNLYILTINTIEGDLDGRHTCEVRIPDNKDQATLDKIKLYAILLERIKAFNRHNDRNKDFNSLKGFSKLFIEDAKISWFHNEYYYDWVYKDSGKWIYYDENGVEFDVKVILDEDGMNYALNKSLWSTDPLMQWSEDYDDPQDIEDDEDEN